MKAATANIEYPEILSDLAHHVSESLVKDGVAKRQAETVAKSAAERVSQHWGGQLVYIPTGAAFRRAKRNLEIIKKWNGRNSLELCREYGLTRARLYQILKVPRNKRADG